MFKLVMLVTNKPRYELLFWAGGGLQTCSSMAAENLHHKVFDSGEWNRRFVIHNNSRKTEKIYPGPKVFLLSLATDKLQLMDVYLNIMQIS